MKRSPRRWSRARRRRYLLTNAPLHLVFYPPSWFAISPEIKTGEIKNDNARTDAEVSAEKEGR